jgi:hypothetical protein
MKTKFFYPLSNSTSVRAVRRLAPVITFCGVLGLLAGCASGPDSETVSTPPPPAPTRSVTTTTTTTTPDTMPAMPADAVGNPGNTIITTTTPAGNTMILATAPPALQTDVTVVQPGPGYVWITGYWTWRNEQYQWMSGHWEMPPNSRSVWVAPTIVPQGNNYRFTEGYWN